MPATTIEPPIPPVPVLHRHEPATDSPWSDPGETAGIPDRYQARTVGGLWLTAGANGRHPDGRYLTPESATPWTVSERRSDPTDPNLAPRWFTAAQGVATSQELARGAAEEAARTMIARRAVPKVLPLGDRHPWPWVGDAWRRGDVAWFQTTEARYQDALEAVPPRYFPRPAVRGSKVGYHGFAGFFLGEPAAHDGRGIPVHAAFVNRAGFYYVREISVDQLDRALLDLAEAISPR